MVAIEQREQRHDRVLMQPVIARWKGENALNIATIESLEIDLYGGGTIETGDDSVVSSSSHQRLMRAEHQRRRSIEQRPDVNQTEAKVVDHDHEITSVKMNFTALRSQERLKSLIFEEIDKKVHNPKREFNINRGVIRYESDPEKDCDWNDRTYWRDLVYKQLEDSLMDTTPKGLVQIYDAEKGWTSLQVIMEEMVTVDGRESFYPQKDRVSLFEVMPDFLDEEGNSYKQELIDEVIAEFELHNRRAKWESARAGWDFDALGEGVGDTNKLSNKSIERLSRMRGIDANVASTIQGDALSAGLAVFAEWANCKTKYFQLVDKNGKGYEIPNVLGFAGKLEADAVDVGIQAMIDYFQAELHLTHVEAKRVVFLAESLAKVWGVYDMGNCVDDIADERMSPGTVIEDRYRDPKVLEGVKYYKSLRGDAMPEFHGEAYKQDESACGPMSWLMKVKNRTYTYLAKAERGYTFEINNATYEHLYNNPDRYMFDALILPFTRMFSVDSERHPGRRITIETFLKPLSQGGEGKTLKDFDWEHSGQSLGVPKLDEAYEQYLNYAVGVYQAWHGEIEDHLQPKKTLNPMIKGLSKLMASKEFLAYNASGGDLVRMEEILNDSETLGKLRKERAEKVNDMSRGYLWALLYKGRGEGAQNPLLGSNELQALADWAKFNGVMNFQQRMAFRNAAQRSLAS